MKPYFSHDEGARNDPKLVRVLMRLGQAGKGVYWDLVEMLHEQGGYLPLGDLESMAFGLRTDLTLLTSLLNDFGLFNQDAERFWSETALTRLQMRNAKAEARAAAGAKGGKAKAEKLAMLQQTSSIASEEPSNAMALPAETLASKEKKRKEKEIESTSSLRSEVGASPEKKIEEAQVVDPLPESPTTELRTPGGAADVGTSVEPEPVKLTKQKGGKELLTGDLAELLNPGGIAERVQKMKSPLTQFEADALCAKYGTEAARQIVKEMANYAKLTNNISANLTAQKWLDKRQPQQVAVMPTYEGRQVHTGVVHPGSVTGRMDTVAQARAELLGQI